MWRLNVVLALTFGGTMSAAAAEQHTPLELFLDNVASGGQFEPGRVVIETDSDLGHADVERLAHGRGCKFDHSFGRRPIHVLLCDPEASMVGLIEAFTRAPGVRWVEAGFYDEPEAIPNDLFELQWYHRNVGQAVDNVTGVMGADLGSIDAWEVSTGSPARVIALIDIGIYTGHQDLAPQVWTNAGENCTNGIDDDNNGYVDDCNGWDIGENDNDASPLTLPTMQPDGDPCLRWHATYIAGLAAARGNNGLGLAGAAWEASIMNLKRHRDSSCSGTSDRAAEATFYAIDNGADVLGYSFNSSTNSRMLQAALTEADVRGLIAVMSAGNGGSNINGSRRYPNNYVMNHKIITGASNNRDQLDPSSNYGSSKVDIASPGTFVVSTAIEAPDAYGVGTGTSMAVGFGLAAVTLAKTAFPTATPDQIYDAILSGGRAIPSMSCANSTRCVRTGRRLDLLGMLRALAPLEPANLTLQVRGVTEIGNNDGEYGPGERAIPQLRIGNTGLGGAFGIKGGIRVVRGSNLSPQTPSRAMGSVATGQTLEPSQYVPAIVVDTDCTTDFDAELEVTVEDVLGRSQRASFALPVRCAAPAPPPDGGVPSDSGAATDAGETSSGSDAGAVVDAGAADATAGTLDAQVGQDAGASSPGPEMSPEPGAPQDPAGCATSPGASVGCLWGLALLGLARRRRG